MSMAYLVGSAYLEWLEQRGGPDSLRHLWVRMTARQRRSFDEAFVGVFGDPPERLYDRFTAELTERAMAVGRAEELREGELWQETTRGSGDPAVSPDGSKLAFVQRNEKGEAKLVVVSTGPNPEEEKFRKQIEKMLKRDPQDVAPVHTKPLPRKPLFTLTPRDGHDITSPRWTRDGKSILYTHKQPDREEFFHHDLFLWTPSSHVNRRITHLADVEDADPLPDGERAVAVRNRYGLSQLIVVNISSGKVTPYNEPTLDKIYSHPRAAADGRIIWAEHDRGGWKIRVEAAALGRSAAGEAPAATLVSGAFSPEWSGTHVVAAVASGGFIDIARVDSGVEFLTRTAGAALDPAPAPDGSLYFMSLEPDGYVIRHLSNVEPALSRLQPLETRLAPAIPPVIANAITFEHAPVGPARRYGFGRQEFSTIFGGAWTAYQRFDELGIRFGDVVGRIDALAIAGDHGGALALTWRGWPVAVSSSFFVLRSSNSTNNEERRTMNGLELRGNYDIYTPLTVTTLEAGALGGHSSRAFVDCTFSARQKSSRASARVAFDSAQHARASVHAAVRFAGIRFGVSAEAGRRMTIGGVASSITPDSLLVERVLDPALPPAFAEVRRYHGARAEVTLGGITGFWQRHSVGAGFTRPAEAGPHTATVRGLEVSTHSEPIPLIGLPALDLTAGAARVSGLRGTKGWITLRWRP